MSPQTDGLQALEALAADSGTAQAAAPPPAPPPTPGPAKPTQTAQPDLDSTYYAHRQNMTGMAALQEMMSEQPQSANDDQATQQQPAAVREQGSDTPTAAAHIFDPNTQKYYATDQNVKSGPGIAAVAKDVGWGAVESPRMIVKGVRDAFQSIADGAADLSSWVENKMGVAKYDTLPKLDLPQMQDATTVTGGLVKSAAQFITSMNAVSKTFQFAELPATVRGAMAMFAGFEGNQKRLSDLVQSVPSLQNPVTEFLSSQPGDNEAVGRLKNAIEGTGLGALTDGLVAGLRTLKGVDTAQAALEQMPEGAGLTGTLAQGPKTDGFAKLGDAEAPPDAPLVKFQVPGEAEADKRYAAGLATEGATPQDLAQMGEPAKPGEVAGPTSPGATEAQAKEPQVYVNFARIDSPDDVKRAMSQMLDSQKDNIDFARRGIQSFEDTKLGAQSVDAWQTLMDRRQGQPLNDQEITAARQLWQQSAVKTQEVMQQALDSPTPENLLAFRKQWATHAMIQQEVVAARTEIARAQSSLRIPVGGSDADRMSSIVNQLGVTGGLKSNLDFLQNVKGLFDNGKLEDLGNVAEKTAWAQTRDALLTGWTNGLLTNWLTHIKVNLSNMATVALRMSETRIAESMDRLMGTQNGVVAGEAAQTAAGLVQGFKDSIRYVGKMMGLQSDVGANPISDAAHAFRTGQYSVGNPNLDWMQSTGHGAAEALGISNSGWVGNAVDMAASVATIPGRALASEHEFWRSIGMRMELNRYAVRQATREVSSGRLAPADFQGRIAELVENPPNSISTAAIDGMTYQTFTDAPGKLSQWIEQGRSYFPMLRVILPFYKIPARMLSFTFERSPFAPLMSGWRADIAAGGARQSMALAKTGLGTGIMLATADAVLNGQITGSGPADKASRQAMMDSGWLPYSIKVGNRWVQYNRLETVGSSMAMAADMTETIRNYMTAVNADDPDVEKLTVAGVATLANNITSKTYLEGLANLFDAISDPRANADRVVKSMAASAVPAGVGALARQMDPYTRETYSMMDAIKARTPGESKTLQPVRNVWGEPVSHESGLGHIYDAFVPFASREPHSEPIDQEIQKQGFNVTLPPSRMAMDGATVDLKNDPKAYSRYVQLAGNELKSPIGGMGDMGLKDTLNALVTGQSPLSAVYNLYEDGADGGKAVMVRHFIEQYRDMAKRQLLDEFPNLQDKVTAAQEHQRALKGVVGMN